MGKWIDEEDEDELPELTDELGDDEQLGIDQDDTFGADEIDDGPEEVGLDVETLEGGELDSALDEDDDESPSLLDEGPLDLGVDDDDGVDEDGWTEESEGSGSAFDEDDQLLEEEEEGLEDDGGLEGVEDPTLDDFAEERETRITIEGDEQETDEELERVELDLG